MSDRRQEGLSAVEVIILVVLVAVVGVAAWTKLGRDMDVAEASFSILDAGVATESE